MEIKNYLETNGNDSTTIQYLLDMTKTVLRGEFTEIQSHLRKQEKSQMNKLNLYLMKVHKEEQTESKVSRRKEIMKIRAETDERDIKKAIAKSKQLKANSEKINKIDKPLARLIKEKKKKEEEISNQ